jgi:hypothetical protein
MPHSKLTPQRCVIRGEIGGGTGFRHQSKGLIEMIKKIIAVALAISMGFVLSAAPSGAASSKSGTTTVTMAGPPTCCGAPAVS